jgi:hypothetical protein
LTAPRGGVLPEAIRRLPLTDKIERLRSLDPTKVGAIELMVDDALEQSWRENFYAGPRGGVMLKSAKAGLESDQRRAKAIAAKGGPL